MTRTSLRHFAKSLFFTLLTLAAFSGSAHAQCTHSSSFGNATINLTGTLVQISSCSFAGEYSTISGAVAGQTLKFTSSVATDYITIHSGTSNGPIIAFGTTPLQFSNTFTGTLFAHWSLSNACGSDPTCRTTTVQLMPVLPPPGTLIGTLSAIASSAPFPATTGTHSHFSSILGVGSFSTSEEERGCSEFDLSTITTVGSATLSFRASAAGPTYGGPAGTFPIQLVAYIGNNAVDISDFEAASIGTIGTFATVGIAVGNTFSFDVTSLVAAAKTAGAAAFGVRFAPTADPGSQTGWQFDTLKIVVGTGAALPIPVASAAGDVVTGGGASDGAGAADGTKFDVLKRGGVIAENGQLVFPGQLLVGVGGVTLSPNTFMGLWKKGTGNLSLLARSGNPAPETGATPANFDVLPQAPAINDSGEVTFLATLATNPSSTPPTTTDNDTGLWSELGGTGLGILIREGDVIPGFSPLQVGAFASGAFATAHTGATTGEAAFAITIKDGANLTDTAILRTSVTSAAVTALGLVARENAAAPGTAENFGNLAGSYSDPMRMDATGNLAFVALTKPSNKEGLWYQPVAGATTKVFTAGDTAPGTTGATFKNIKSPAIGSGGVITFRGLLNADGDNAAGLKNDGIWRGTGSTAAGYTCILRRGDAAVPGLPGGSKVGNLWHSWLTNANHGAWKGWLDVDGNGTSAAPTDVHAIYSDLSGTMNFVLKVGDAAPGIAGATFSGFDLPVVGGVEQMAFIGNVTGGGTTSANNSGVWRSAPNGGALTLVIRTGDTMTTSQGVRTIQKVDFPGSGSTDRRWEQPIMDATGRLIVFVTFTTASGGGTSQILVP